MNEKDKLLQLLIEEKGGSQEDYESLLNKIAYHESAHTMDPSIKQYGGGPGRGKYQFEEGENQGAITASRRLERYMKEKDLSIPKWLKQANKGNSLDVSKLTSEQQDMLFLGNMRMHPKADLANVIEGKESVTDFWAKYHWAGSIKDRKKRVESFNRSLKQYNDVAESPVKKSNSPEGKNIDIIPRNETVRDNTNITQASREFLLNQQPIAQEGKQPSQVQPQQSSMDDLMSYIKQKYQPKQDRLPTNSNNLNIYNGGGTHGQNPLGGIPQGIGANGKPNSVESDETSFELPGGKFVFSDRVAIGGKKREVSNSYNNKFLK